MSQLMIVPTLRQFPYNLGQTEPAPPDVIDPNATISEIWEHIKSFCAQYAGEERCARLLPQDPIWMPAPAREGFGIPWWGWLGIGFLSARILR